MEENKLEIFQENGINEISNELREYMSVCGVSPTGSGKSVIIANIAYRFINKNPNKNVIIFVHRDELLNGIRKELLKWFNIISQKIDRHTNYIDQNCRIFVSMVETFDRRSESNSFLDNFKSIGLCMVDECHLDSFTKIFEHFLEAKRIGFTATPKLAKKNKALKDYYQRCVIISNIPELIDLNKIKRNRGVVPALEYDLGTVDKKKFGKKGDDYDEKKMGDEFGDKYQIQNTLKAYLNLAYNKKTIIFNANIDHSIKMHNALIEAGLNSRHLDSDKKGKFASDKYRKETWEWFENTPNAILNNVGIATIGNDVKSIECVIINKSTLSETLFRQMIGRGSRAFIFDDGRIKEYFMILDMGKNLRDNHSWRYDYNVDWKEVFYNPRVSKREGVAPIKTCPECGAINYATARFCQGKVINQSYDAEKRESFFNKRLLDCGFMFSFNIREEDLIEREMILLSNKINVPETIKVYRDKKEYYSFFNIFQQIAAQARETIKSNYLDSKQLVYLYEIAYNKACEWNKVKEKRRYSNFKEDIKDKLLVNLKNLGFDIPVEEIEELNISI